MARRHTTPSTGTPPGRFARHGSRVLDDPRHDPYEARGKYGEGTGCTVCGAAYRNGRWQWARTEGASRHATCPACRRTQDRMPAGRVVLDGPYVAAHRAELVRLVRNQAEQEQVEHPMHRVMTLDEQADRVEVGTTDIHLPRRIGESLRRAHDGELAIAFGKDAYEIRVHWRR